MKKYIKPVSLVLPVDVDTDLMETSPVLPVNNKEGNGIQRAKGRYDDFDYDEEMDYDTEEDLW